MISAISAIPAAPVPGSYRVAKQLIALHGRPKKMTQDINRKPNSSAAARMRLYRRRRREQLRCVTIQLHNLEVQALIHRGWLEAERRHHPAAIQDALHAYLGYTLLGERDA